MEDYIGHNGDVTFRKMEEIQGYLRYRTITNSATNDDRLTIYGVRI